MVSGDDELVRSGVSAVVDVILVDEDFFASGDGEGDFGADLEDTGDALFGVIFVVQEESAFESLDRFRLDQEPVTEGADDVHVDGR